MGLEVPINSSSGVLIDDEFWELSVGEVCLPQIAFLSKFQFHFCHPNCLQTPALVSD